MDNPTHAYLGKPDENSGKPIPYNGECQRVGCGKLRFAKVHAGYEPEFLPAKPTPMPVGMMVGLNDVGQMIPMGRPVHATDTIPAVQAWDAYAAQVRTIIIEKSGNYGDAWQEQGWRGNLARVLSKVSRLKYMLWCTDPRNSSAEPVDDTLIDLGALAAFMMANRRDGNEWGR